jgi:hypothetical protein
MCLHIHFRYQFSRYPSESSKNLQHGLGIPFGSARLGGTHLIFAVGQRKQKGRSVAVLVEAVTLISGLQRSDLVSE